MAVGSSCYPYFQHKALSEKPIMLCAASTHRGKPCHCTDNYRNFLRMMPKRKKSFTSRNACNNNPQPQFSLKCYIFNIENMVAV
jgi:hypothetical protein